MDYQSNSHKSKEKATTPPEKKVEKVVSTEVVQRKKPVGRRLKELFFGGEAKGAARYIAGEVLLPALRNLIVDASTEGIRRIVYGESASRQRRSQPMRSQVSYHNPMAMRRDPRLDARLPDQGPRPIAPSRSYANEIILTSRSEAELVLERLIDILDTYEVASVADLHDLVGLPSSHVDNKWGWTYLTNATIRQVREGFVLELPPTEPI